MQLVPRPEYGLASRAAGWIDQAIGVLAPGWAADRLASRVAQGELERLSYRAARHTRLDRRTASQGLADTELELTHGRRVMVDRARQLERSSVLADGYLSRSVEFTVGCGFGLQAKTNSEAWNKRAERLWKDWATSAADVRGMETFNGLLGLVLRSYLRDGDVGAILLSDGSLQLVESDQISSPYGTALQRNLIDGVELDRRGRPIAFHVVDDPDPLNPAVRYQGLGRRTRVPAESFVFLARRKRLGQTRGITAFSNVAWLLDQIDGNVEAVTAAARMAACLGLVIARKNRMSGLPVEAGADGKNRRRLSLEPGAMIEVGQGDTVTQINPSQPGQNWPEFVRMLARLVGVSFGIPVEIGMLNFEKSNFSNARTALMQAWQVWRCHQLMLKGFATRVYHWRILDWMERGLLPVRSDALTHVWTSPGWQWIDPEKEIKSTMAACDAGLDSLQRAAARMGLDWEELLEEQRAAAEKRAAAGLPDVRSTLTRDPNTSAPAAPQDGDDEPKEDPDA